MKKFFTFCILFLLVSCGDLRLATSISTPVSPTYYTYPNTYYYSPYWNTRYIYYPVYNYPVRPYYYQLHNPRGHRR